MNDPGYVDVSVSATPVIWTGSLSTAWNQPDTLPAPMNWSYAGSGTNFQAGDIVQFDNSTGSGGTVNISNGNVQPDGILFNNNLGHAYTLTGTYGIGGSGQLVKNGPGTLTIVTSNAYSGGTDIYAGTLIAGTPGALGTGGLAINGGTLVAAAEAVGTNTVLGHGSNSRAITVNAGGVLEFIAPNATATAFNSTNVATLDINGGTVTNAEPAPRTQPAWSITP